MLFLPFSIYVSVLQLANRPLEVLLSHSGVAHRHLFVGKAEGCLDVGDVDACGWVVRGHVTQCVRREARARHVDLDGQGQRERPVLVSIYWLNAPQPYPWRSV
jgi:hypothetical protein